MNRLTPVPALSLTLPPLVLPGPVRRLLLVALITGLGLVIAWLPPMEMALLLAGVIFAGVTLIQPTLILYLLILVIPFSPLVAVQVGRLRAGGMELLLAWGLLTWLLQSLVRRLPPAGPLTRSFPLLVPFLVFLGAVGLSWLNSLSLGASLVETAKWLEMLALYLFIVATLPARRIHWVVAALLLAGVGQALLGLYQFVFKVGPEGFLLFGGRFLRAYGTFAQPNPYAGYLGLVLPLALALVVWGLTGKLNHHSARPALIFSLPALGLLLAGLFASQSRSAWLGFAAAAVVILAVRSRRMVALLAVLVLLAALSGLAGAFQTAASQLDAGPAGQAYGIIAGRLVSALDIISIRDISTIEVTDANFATLERLAHWQAAREMWRDRPWLGVGFGNYEVIYPAYAPGRWLDPLGHAHNYLLNLGAETGLVGMIAYLIFWILIFRVTYLAVHYSAGFYQAVAAGGLGILTHLHVHNLFDNLYVQGMYLHMTVILALISLVYRTFCLPDLVIAPSSPPVTGAANDLHTVSKAKSTSND